jgi:predicted metal-binding membrane protein
MSELTANTALLRRDKFVVLGGLAGVVALAWLYLLYLAQGMGEMSMNSGMATAMKPDRWGVADFGAMFVMWVIMMVGMMLPGATPMILMFAKVSRKHRLEERSYPSVAVFVSGYLLAWGGFSLVATGLQSGLQSLLLLSPMMTTNSPLLGATLFVTAGLYQLTPLKHACLKHCRSPLAFLLTRWRGGSLGAFRMGFEHGLFCLGCCWVIMALLFVGGVMNLLWVVAITVFVLIEKIAPRGERFARGTGFILIAVGLLIAASAPV